MPTEIYPLDPEGYALSWDEASHRMTQYVFVVKDDQGRVQKAGIGQGGPASPANAVIDTPPDFTLPGQAPHFTREMLEKEGDRPPTSEEKARAQLHMAECNLQAAERRLAHAKTAKELIALATKDGA